MAQYSAPTAPADKTTISLNLDSLCQTSNDSRGSGWEFRWTESNNEVRKRVTACTLPDAVGSNYVDSDIDNVKKMPLYMYEPSCRGSRGTAPHIPILDCT
jgi:hypothetical protein